MSTPAEVLLSVWLFAFGGAVGSFLNVVVYRLPLGMSLILPSSHCPACRHPIRWYDNVPIFGWLTLKGRCRDCGANISFRYPLVEAVTAVVFLVMGRVEWFSFGGNLPVRPIPVAGGTDFFQLTPGEALGIVAYHALLLSTLLAAALIEYDGKRLPARLFRPAILVGLAAPLLWPHLHPVPALARLSGAMAGLADGAAGLAAGLALGLAACLIIGPRDRRGLPFGLAMAGLFLGWQAVVALGLLVALVHAVVEALRPWWPSLTRTSPGLWLFVATWAWILEWDVLVRRIT